VIYQFTKLAIGTSHVYVGVCVNKSAGEVYYTVMYCV